MQHFAREGCRDCIQQRHRTGTLTRFQTNIARRAGGKFLFRLLAGYKRQSAGVFPMVRNDIVGLPDKYRPERIETLPFP
jgi:hypothetical protein